MRILFVSLLLLIAQSLLAQTSSLKGSVRDTMDKKALPNAVVALIKKKDSSLYRFSRSAKDGSFFLNDVEPGDYRLLITYPKFADFAPKRDVGAK